MRRWDKFRGCLVGGTIGDARGSTIEFMTIAQIRQRFGSEEYCGTPVKLP